MKAFFVILILLVSVSSSAVETGNKAPEFNLQGTSLASFKGKLVVLEWLNHGCPFVKKHYSSGNMQALQKKYTAKGIVWLSIISSAPGKQGYVDEKQALSEKKLHHSQATQVLLDPTGEVGKLYEAKTTPHMYVIDQKGLLVYQGAIDDKADADPGSVSSARNYVSEALDSLLVGQAIKVAQTKAYGCGVKY
jgi:thioredoxin-related protein